MIKTQNAETFQLLDTLESLRNSLLSSAAADRLAKPLAYWAVAGDRGLPIRLLGHKLSDLLAMPLETITAMPGIGTRKLQTLLVLLERAAQDIQTLAIPGPGMLADRMGNAAADVVALATDSQKTFSSPSVTESEWQEWRQTVTAFDVGGEKLGRFVSSLHALPKSLWHAPLSQFLDFDLAQLRCQKSLGAKRIAGILQVFYEVNRILSRFDQQCALGTRLAPRFVVKIESWIESVLASSQMPTPAQVHQHLVVPLLEQLQIDARATLYDIAAMKLNVRSVSLDVKQLARKTGLTWAHIYLYLKECGEIMNVRWPGGRYDLEDLVEKLSGHGADPVSLQLVNAVREVFYPSPNGGRKNGKATAATP